MPPKSMNAPDSTTELIIQDCPRDNLQDHYPFWNFPNKIYEHSKGNEGGDEICIFFSANYE